MDRLRWLGSVVVECHTSGTLNEVAGLSWNAAKLPGQTPTPGYIGHLAFALKPAPDCEDPTASAIEHLCLPWRRQHAGRFASESNAKAVLSNELKRANNRIAEMQRKRF
jgi:hypothetical protein